MSAYRCSDLSLGHLNRQTKLSIQKAIKDVIPVGSSAHRKPLQNATDIIRKISAQNKPSTFLKSEIASKPKKVLNQIGTLGGGNHFIEILSEGKENEASPIWLMLHSGSRFIGNHIASHYNREAMV